MALQDLRYFVPYVSYTSPKLFCSCAQVLLVRNPRSDVYKRLWCVTWHASMAVAMLCSHAVFNSSDGSRQDHTQSCRYIILILFLFLNMVRSWSTAFLPGLWAAHGEEQLVKNPKSSQADWTAFLYVSICSGMERYGTKLAEFDISKVHIHRIHRIHHTSCMKSCAAPRLRSGFLGPRSSTRARGQCARDLPHGGAA